MCLNLWEKNPLASTGIKQYYVRVLFITFHKMILIAAYIYLSLWIKLLLSSSLVSFAQCFPWSQQLLSQGLPCYYPLSWSRGREKERPWEWGWDHNKSVLNHSLLFGRQQIVSFLLQNLWSRTQKTRGKQQSIVDDLRLQ